MSIARTPPYVVTLQSAFDFEPTVERITQALEARGHDDFLPTSTQSAAASRADTTLRPTRLILFGNPKGGTPIMEANPHARAGTAAGKWSCGRTSRGKCRSIISTPARCSSNSTESIPPQPAPFQQIRLLLAKALE